MPNIFPIMPYAKERKLLVVSETFNSTGSLVCEMCILLGSEIVINGNKGEWNKIVIHII